jgi:hypothetical protein
VDFETKTRIKYKIYFEEKFKYELRKAELSKKRKKAKSSLRKALVGVEAQLTPLPDFQHSPQSPTHHEHSETRLNILYKIKELDEALFVQIPSLVMLNPNINFSPVKNGEKGSIKVVCSGTKDLIDQEDQLGGQILTALIESFPDYKITTFFELFSPPLQFTNNEFVPIEYSIPATKEDHWHLLIQKAKDEIRFLEEVESEGEAKKRELKGKVHAIVGNIKAKKPHKGLRSYSQKLMKMSEHYIKAQGKVSYAFILEFLDIFVTNLDIQKKKDSRGDKLDIKILVSKWMSESGWMDFKNMQMEIDSLFDLLAEHEYTLEEFESIKSLVKTRYNVKGDKGFDFTSLDRCITTSSHKLSTNKRDPETLSTIKDLIEEELFEAEKEFFNSEI